MHAPFRRRSHHFLACNLLDDFIHRGGRMRGHLRCRGAACCAPTWQGRSEGVTGLPDLVGVTNHQSPLLDLIASNPPYIGRREAATLMREVRDHEPEIALYGGEEGYELYADLIAQSAAHLKPSGILVLELGITVCLPLNHFSTPPPDKRVRDQRSRRNPPRPRRLAYAGIIHGYMSCPDDRFATCCSRALGPGKPELMR